MDIQTVISQLKSQFGDKLDIAKVTEFLKGLDLSKISMSEITSKLTNSGLLKNFDEAKLENITDELKGKAGQMLGGLGKMFGK